MSVHGGPVCYFFKTHFLKPLATAWDPLKKILRGRPTQDKKNSAAQERACTIEVLVSHSCVPRSVLPCHCNRQTMQRRPATFRSALTFSHTFLNSTFPFGTRRGLSPSFNHTQSGGPGGWQSRDRLRGPAFLSGAELPCCPERRPSGLPHERKANANAF